MEKEQPGLLRLLVTLTVLFLLSELLFLGITIYANGSYDRSIYKEIIAKLAAFAQMSTMTIFMPLLLFVFSQILSYVILVYLIWFVVTSLGDLFSLSARQIRYSGIIIWAIAISTILIANTYFVRNSSFGVVVRGSVSNKLLSEDQLKNILVIMAVTCLFVLALALCNLCYGLLKRRHVIRNVIMGSLIVFILIVYCYHSAQTYPVFSGASEKKPNIFIIGFDAIRPDYLSYFNSHRKPTPQFDEFLKSSVVFTEGYTPVARTMSSWATILTGKYPLHTNAREDNINVATIKLDMTLAKVLGKAGYNTIYVTDDNRFSSINNPAYGFEHTFGPSGNVIDFILSGVSDFPISNLLTITKFGRILFPYNFANHALPFLYQPEDFMQLIFESLHGQENQPVFFAAHFNITSWPFYFLDDNQPYGANTLSNYKNAITAADDQLGKFLALLNQEGLLTNAIFVLVSDHGITLDLPGDRVVTEALYEGNKADIKLLRSAYSNVVIVAGEAATVDPDGESKYISLGDASLLQDKKEYDEAMSRATDPRNPALYGIDTSWGYGIDVLSLKQNHHVFAIRTYSSDSKSNVPHKVSGLASLMDITPTVLDMLNLEPQKNTDGISLKPCLLDPALNLQHDRPFFLESTLTDQALRDKLSIAKLVAATIEYFDVNPANGLVIIKPAAEILLIKSKQRAVLSGDWLLAYYPESIRFKMIPSSSSRILDHYKNYISPAYTVLVNLKTGKWTTDLQGAFAVTAPVRSLEQMLNTFYGKEMDNYKLSK